LTLIILRLQNVMFTFRPTFKVGCVTELPADVGLLSEPVTSALEGDCVCSSSSEDS